MWAYLSLTLLGLSGLFLMIVVLLQKGRGGGLAGAFGGAGGQSAFGTKAGDVFTKITVVIAVFWVGLAGVSGFALRAGAERRYSQDAPEGGTIEAIEADGDTGTSGSSNDDPFNSDFDGDDDDKKKKADDPGKSKKADKTKKDSGDGKDKSSE